MSADDKKEPVPITEADVVARMESDRAARSVLDAAIEWDLNPAKYGSSQIGPPILIEYALTKAKMENEAQGEPLPTNIFTGKERTPEQEAAFAADVAHELAGGHGLAPSIAQEMEARRARIAKPARGKILTILRESGVADLPDGAHTPQVRAALRHAFLLGHKLDAEGREELQDRCWPLARKHGYNTIDDVAHVIGRGW